VLCAVGDAMTLNLPRIDLVDLVSELHGLVGTHLEGGQVPVLGDGRPGAVLTAAPESAGLFEALRTDDLGRWYADKRRTGIGK
jgi:hypothetical protein